MLGVCSTPSGLVDLNAFLLEKRLLRHSFQANTSPSESFISQGQRLVDLDAFVGENAAAAAQLWDTPPATAQDFDHGRNGRRKGYKPPKKGLRRFSLHQVPGNAILLPHHDVIWPTRNPGAQLQAAAPVATRNGECDHTGQRLMQVLSSDISNFMSAFCLNTYAGGCNLGVGRDSGRAVSRFCVSGGPFV